MNNKKVVIPSLIVMSIFILFSTLYWYTYFLDLGSDGKLVKKVDTKGEGLIIIEKNKIYVLYDEEGKDVPGYKFEIHNKNNKTQELTIKLVDIKPEIINDGCTKNTTFPKNVLNYELLLDEKTIKSGTLDKLEDNILDTREINKDSILKYELKISLNNLDEKYLGMHYHYKIVLED